MRLVRDGAVKSLLVLGLALLAGCGEGASDPRARLALLAAERGQSVAPPPGPAWHLRAIGRVIFPTELTPLEQDAELWIGGPDRLKFVMTAFDGGSRNLFLLDGSAGCWLRTNSDPWREWPSAELLTESLLRWALLRFPWDWQEEIASADPGAMQFARTTDFGELILELDPHGLPQAASCAGVRAEVGDWRKLSPGPRIAPFHWSWTGPSGRRAEEYDELREDLRYFDEAFRPPPAANASRTQITGDAVERLGVIQARLWLVRDADLDAAMNAPSWWQHDGQRVAAVLLDADAPAPLEPSGSAQQAAADEWWLRWSFVGPAEDAAILGDQLLKAAELAGLTMTGSPWVRETLKDGRAHGQILLVPVSAPR